MDPNHWNDVYSKKGEKEVSWFQEIPTLSLQLIEELKLSKNDPIIDIGAGESRLVDNLVDLGYGNISVLDISETALNQLKTRLGEKSKNIHFIASDVLKFDSSSKFKLWHDRATFHFLTESQDVVKYLEILKSSLVDKGYLIISTFSQNGPNKCSGLPVKQYSDFELKKLFEKYFDNVKCLEQIHKTPWGSEQAFVYCGFVKK